MNNNLYEANKKRGEKGILLKSNVYDVILHTPYINGYKIATYLNTKLGSIRTYINQLINESQIIELESSIYNRIQKQYYVPDPDSNVISKLIIPENIVEVSNLKKWKKIYFIAKSSEYFLIKDKIEQTDYEAIIIKKLTLKQEKGNFFFKLPVNILNFFQVLNRDPDLFSIDLEFNYILYSVKIDKNFTFTLPNPIKIK